MTNDMMNLRTLVERPRRRYSARDDLHLLLAEFLHMVGAAWTSPVALQLRRAGLQLHCLY